MLLENLIVRKNREINVLKKGLTNSYNRQRVKENIIYLMEELQELIIINNELYKRIKKFTAEEVKKYNGVGDNLAYIIIEGTVYDVTGVKEFNNEKCNFKFGEDGTKEFYGCLKGDKGMLQGLRIVGVLKE